MKRSIDSLLAIKGIVCKTIAVFAVVCLLLPVSAYAASDTAGENGSAPTEEAVDYEEIERLLSEQSRILEERKSLDKESAAYQEATKRLAEIEQALEQLGLEEEIDRLMSERSRLETEKYYLDKNDVEAVKQIDEKLKENQTLLEKLGVEFLTFEEVQEQFGDKYPEGYLEASYKMALEEREKLLAQKMALDPNDVEAAARIDKHLEWIQKELDWLESKGIPQTGDNSQLMLWLPLLIISAAGIAVLCSDKTRRKIMK